MLVILTGIGLAGVASAAEVVWLSPPSDADRDRVAAAAGARGGPLDPLDLRAAGTAFGPSDDQAWAKLEATLRDVHRYESELDGEKLIMDDLAAAIAGIGAVRDGADRDRLFAALAYQGFAVDRYFDKSLLKDPAAASWRDILGGAAWPAPWIDALAIEPGRDVTPYDIAEAQQRKRYADVKRASATWLPAELVPVEWPAGAALVVDGRPAEPDAAGTVKVGPGRHYAHALLDGRCVARWTLDVESVGRVELAPPIDDASFGSFTANPGAFTVPPSGLRDAIAALGGSVWIAKPGPAGPSVWEVTGSDVHAVALDPQKVAKEHEGGGGRALTLHADAYGGWLGSQDLWLQAPSSTPATFGDVNRVSVGAGVGADHAVGPVAIGAGVDVGVPLGGAALVGDGSLAVRPYPHVRVGLKRAQLTAGWMFPWYLAIGAIGSVPLPGPLELRPRVTVGLPTTWAREYADWTTTTTVTAGLGIGLAR